MSVMTIDDPEVVAEVTAQFEAYEQAFVSNDVEALDKFFYTRRRRSASAAAKTFSATRRSRRFAPHDRRWDWRENSRRRASSPTGATARSRRPCSAATRAGQDRAADADLGALSRGLAHRRRPYQHHRRAKAMKSVIAGVVLLPTDGAPSGRRSTSRSKTAALPPSRRRGPAKKRLAMPALVNAHDHCRAVVADFVRRRQQAARELAPASRRNARGRSLSRGAMRLRPRRARRSGIGDGALHAFSWTHVARRRGSRDRSRRRRHRRARHVRRFHARQAIRWSMATRTTLLGVLPPSSRAPVEAKFLKPMPSVEEQIARVEAHRGGGRERDLLRGVRAQRPAVVFR